PLLPLPPSPPPAASGADRERYPAPPPPLPMDSSSDNFVAPVDERQDPPLPNPSEEEAGGEEKEWGEEKTLERAEELFDKGSKAIEEGDFVVAVDRLSRALEIRVERYGELASECASTYYKYGCALLYKSQEETDPLGNVPKSAPDEEPAKSTTNKDSGNSKASSSNVKDDDPSSDKGGLEGVFPLPK
uniref:Tetratricopeptide SHNi-TPR domain-containing protein n=1 Tax=Aegilops tauschii subsp. strangulata TaxID=200361 RepID=A0A453BP12_AEGTS